MKKIFLVFVLLALTVQAQEKQGKKKPDVTVKGLYFALHTGQQSFQDTRYSDLRYDGMIFGGQLGYYNQKEKRIWQVGAHFFTGEKSTTVGMPYTTISFRLHFDYLRNIFHKGKQHLYLGGRFDLLDIYNRTLNERADNKTDLLNNPSSSIIGTQFSAKALYMYDLNEKWQWQSVLRVQLFGFMKQDPSFATSLPQHLLEDRQTLQENEDPFGMESPIGIFNSNFQPFYKYVNIALAQSIVYRQKWRLTYRWVFKRSREVVGMPVNLAQHFLSIGYQF